VHLVHVISPFGTLLKIIVAEKEKKRKKRKKKI